MIADRPRDRVRPTAPKRTGRAARAGGCLAASALLLLLAVVALSAQGDPWVVVFYEAGCPSCEQIEELLELLSAEIPASAIVRHDVSDPTSLRLLTALTRAYDVELTSVPIVFVGDVVIVGSGWTQERQLTDAVSRCAMYGCPSPLRRTATAVLSAGLLRLTVLAILFALLWWWQTS